ncbi:MAG TPA: hypothetical protein VE093_38520 [Polyangiaceae bacterium]|jgi:hypothetical protein|nr:hypothetical protein [Polyangiaceae bacterium]
MAQGIQTTLIDFREGAPLLRTPDARQAIAATAIIDCEIITRTATVRLDARGFVHVVVTPLAEQHLADAIENVEAVRQLSRESRLPILVDMRRVKSIDNAAHERYRAGHTPAPRAMAMLVASPLSRIIANYFTTMYECPIPTRVFTSEVDALGWIAQHIG